MHSRPAATMSFAIYPPDHIHNRQLPSYCSRPVHLSERRGSQRPILSHDTHISLLQAIYLETGPTSSYSLHTQHTPGLTSDPIQLDLYPLLRSLLKVAGRLPSCDLKRFVANGGHITQSLFSISSLPQSHAESDATTARLPGSPKKIRSQ